MSNYKNVIFDVGDVLISFRYRDYMRDLGFPEETIEFLKDNMIFTDFWVRMDRGDEDVDDACEYFCGLYPELKQALLQRTALSLHPSRALATDLSMILSLMSIRVDMG